MMMYYRFSILLAICIACLGFVPINSRRDLSALASFDARTDSLVSELLAQAPTNSENSSPSTANSAYDRYMQAGYEADEKKDYKKALENFEKALLERPGDRYAQQAIQNVETKQNYQNNTSSWLWWLALGAGLTITVGTGAFFFSGLMRRGSYSEKVEQKEEELEQETLDPEKNFELHSIASENSQNHFGDGYSNNNNKAEAHDNSLPLQTPTRLPNINLVDELVKDLQEPDPKKRRKAIWELAQKGDSRAMKPLVDLMIDSDSQERSLVLEALSQISIRTLKPMNQALAISLQDKNPQVRKNAIRDLTRIYDLMSQISQMLRHAMDDSDADVQETAKWALSQLNLQMTPTRLDLLPMQRNESTP
jgi:hypothetical protein